MKIKFSCRSSLLKYVFFILAPASVYALGDACNVNYNVLSVEIVAETLEETNTDRDGEFDLRWDRSNNDQVTEYKVLEYVDGVLQLPSVTVAQDASSSEYTISIDRGITDFKYYAIVQSCDANNICSTGTASQVITVKRRNILVMIVDDFGMDILKNVSPISGLTPDQMQIIESESVTAPNITNIASKGVSFTNTWVNPTCGPTRATLLTGKYANRTLVHTSGAEIPIGEVTLPEVLENDDYRTAIIGKWHPNSFTDNPMDNEPYQHGFDHHAGTHSNLSNDGSNPDLTYRSWRRVVNGLEDTDGTLVLDDQTTSCSSYSQDKCNEYVTNVLVRDASKWINHHHDTFSSQPWFMWLSFITPHFPLTIPDIPERCQDPVPTDPAWDLPEDCRFRNQLHNGFSNGHIKHQAMVEHLDEQIGMLLSQIPKSELQHTTVIFIGDNGTAYGGQDIANVVTNWPILDSHGKGKLYMQGIEVPLLVSGAGVIASGMDERLVNGVDLYATVIDLAEIDPALAFGTDSISFAPALTDLNSPRDRAYAFSERVRCLSNFSTPAGTDGWTIRDNKYKLMRYRVVESGVEKIIEEFYNVELNPLEIDNGNDDIFQNLCDAPTQSELCPLPNVTLEEQEAKSAYDAMIVEINSGLYTTEPDVSCQ